MYLYKWAFSANVTSVYHASLASERTCLSLTAICYCLCCGDLASGQSWCIAIDCIGVSQL